MDLDDGDVIKKLMAHAIRQRLRKAVRLIAAVSKKSNKNVEDIHHLRSETRRADAALRLFIDWVPRSRAERIRRQLGEIRGKAGSVRDLDVMLPLIKALDSHLPKDAIEWLLERAKSLRTKRSHSLTRHCWKLLNQGFEGRTRLLTHHVHWRQESSVPRLRESLLLAIDQLATRFYSTVGSLKDDAEQLHKARILGRRLRYTLDLLRDFLPDSPIEAISQILTEIQDSLGFDNDRQSMLQFLQACATKCDKRAFAVPLVQVIDSFEATRAQQRNSVVQSIAAKVKDVQYLLTELESSV